MTHTKKPSTVSILNWMGSLILFSIPGVNLLFIILTLIFAKAPSKRNFAWALLILTALILVAGVALLALFPDQSASLANALREAAAVTAG